MKSNDWRHKNVARYTPGNTKILYFFNCLLDGMHTKTLFGGVFLPAANSYLDLAAVVASLEAAVVSVDVSVAVESALFKDTCAQSFWSTSLL